MSVSHEEDESGMDAGTTATSFSRFSSTFPESNAIDTCYPPPTLRPQTLVTGDNNTSRIKEIFRTSLDNSPVVHRKHQEDEDNFNFLLSQSPGKVLEVLMDDDPINHGFELSSSQGFDPSSLKIKDADLVTYPSQQLRKHKDTTQDEETKLYSFPPLRITPDEFDFKNNRSNSYKKFGDVDQYVKHCLKDTLEMEIDDVQLDDTPSVPADGSCRTTMSRPSTISQPSSPDEPHHYIPLPRSSLQPRTSLLDCSQLAAEFSVRKTRILHGKPENIVHPFFKKYLPLPDSLRPVVGFLLQMEAHKYPRSILEHACGIVTSKLIECQFSHDNNDLAGKVFSILASDIGSKGIKIDDLFRESDMKLSERSLDLNEMQEKIQLFFCDSSPDDECFSHRHGRKDHGQHHHPHHYDDWHPNGPQYHEPRKHQTDRTVTVTDSRSTYQQPESVQDLLKLAIAYGALHGGRFMSSSQNDHQNPNSLISASFSEFVDGGHSYLHHMTDDEKRLLWNHASSIWPGPRFEA